MFCLFQFDELPATNRAPFDFRCSIVGDFHGLVHEWQRLPIGVLVGFPGQPAKRLQVGSQRANAVFEVGPNDGQGFFLGVSPDLVEAAFVPVESVKCVHRII